MTNKFIYVLTRGSSTLTAASCSKDDDGTADGTVVSYDYAEVRNVSFGDVTSTGIDDVTSSPVCDVVFRLLDGKVVVEGLPAGESVSVYNVGGQLLASKKQTATGVSLTLPLEGSSVLIVRTSTGVSYKVMLN